MIKNLVEELFKLDQNVWGAYAYSREPLEGKLNKTQKKEYKAKSEACGREIALELKKKYGKLTSRKYAKKIGVTVIDSNDQDKGGYVMFAKFNEPNEVTVYTPTVDLGNNLIMSEGLSEMLGNINVEDILIAHELYHYFECKRPELYTTQTKVKLWSIGFLKNESKLICLSELGAMEFAKELLSLDYSPYIFDVILLYTQNKRKARELFDSICKLNL